MAYIGRTPTNAALTASDLADGIVSSGKIAADAVTSAKIADNAVVTAAINADAVTDAKIADDVVGTEHLTANEVDTTALGADAVTGAQLADDAVNSEHYTDGSIDTAHLADGQVTIGKLATAVLTGATDIGADIADADLFLLDDGAGGTLRKTAASRIKTYVGGGITEADVWRITASFTGTAEPVTANWERADDATAGQLGTGMSESSGIFTFPSTGIWRVSMFRNIYGNNQTDRAAKTNIDVSSDGTNYDLVSFSFCSTHSGENVGFVHGSSVASAIIDVTNASNFRVRFDLVHINSSAATYGDTNANLTWAEFVRLGDT